MCILLELKKSDKGDCDPFLGDYQGRRYLCVELLFLPSVAPP